MTVRRSRAIAGAVAIGALAGAVSLLLFPLSHGGDFVQFHFAAGKWLSGHDPYVGGFPAMRATRVIPEPFFYPFPALLALAPFALLPLPVACVAFVTLSTIVLSYAVIRCSPERLPLFFGSGFLVAIVLGQWSPLLTASILLPSLTWLAVIKPNLGLAVIVTRRTWLAMAIGATLVVVTLVIQPTWPFQWLRNLHSMPPHPAPIMEPGGLLILLALLRWRRAEARLLIAMACVPQVLYFADQLPLWMIPQDRRQSTLLSAVSVLAWFAALVVTIRSGQQPALSSTYFVLAGVYLPAVIMVLRRPNVGPMPGRIEALVAGLPAWLRGSAA
jgi:hypothetical protein